MSLADYGVADGDILNLIIKQHDPALHVAAPEPEPQPEPQPQPPHEGVPPPARGAPILFKGDVWTVGGQAKGQPLGLLFDEGASHQPTCSDALSERRSAVRRRGRPYRGDRRFVWSIGR